MSGRDRSFEKALARHFPTRASNPLCPDPETLAAYHENALAPEELLAWKKHFAGCLRCQELLKHLAATENQALAPRETAMLGATAPSYTVMAAPRSRLRLWWASYWRWVVPAGALAAGLFVWVAIRPTPRPNLQMAKNQPTPPLTEESVKNSPAPRKSGAPQPEASREADRALAFERVPADAAKVRAKGTLEKSEAQARSSVPPAADANSRDQKGAGAQSASKLARTENFLYRSERPVVKPGGAAGVSDSLARSQQEPPGMPPKAAESVVVTQETARAEPMESKAPAVVGGTLGSLPAAREQWQGANKSLLLQRVSTESPVMILTPEGRVQWRAGMAGTIERSADGGRSWVAQRSGVAADLLAGSAVSDEVCWIIGRGGTILRTTDGGAHWRKLPSPSAQDLAAVRASDAQQAVIFDAANQRAYKTTDGGASWTALPTE